ncbi:MAG TPA: helix-turn-helix transcriptional regulator [Micromonosporaceae bacterium]
MGRRRLGAELRRYRDAAGLTIDRVAHQLRCSASKISRIETGQTGASPRDVRDMLMLYQVSETELVDLIEVARDTRQRGWWRPYGSVLTGSYVGFEAAAQLIRTFEAQLVPSLLQTEEYAYQVIGARQPNLSPAEIKDRVRVKMARQTLLTQQEPVTFWCVLDEAVLARSIGGPPVMRRQLEHLCAVAELPNVTVQVLPFEHGAHIAMEGAFVLLSFPHRADPDTVYLPTSTGGVFQEKADKVAEFTLVFETLQRAALAPEQSVEFLGGLAAKLPTP